MPGQSDSEYPRLSDGAQAHMATLIVHRHINPDDLPILVEVFPERCRLCREIADWAAAVDVTDIVAGAGRCAAGIGGTVPGAAHHSSDPLSKD